METRITVPTAETAPEAAQPLLAAITKQMGRVPNLFAAIGNSPNALEGYLAFDGLVAKGTLSRREIEQISLHVSELNGCAYCVSAHDALSRRAKLTPDEIDAARLGTGSNERENAILALARRAVRASGHGSRTELDRAREAGVTDAQIIEIFATVALKHFTNTVAVAGRIPVDFPAAPRLPQA